MISIAATLGDPLGIGPEVSAKALTHFFQKSSDFRVQLFGPEWAISPHWNSHLEAARKSRRLVILGSFSKTAPRSPGKASGRIALDALSAATESCLTSQSNALVTGPLDKSLCALSLPRFSGHTEYLQKKCKSSRTTMLMVSSQLKIALVTTHVAIKDVAKNISVQSIFEISLQVAEHLRSIKSQPRIAILALNPHASDGGLFGTEEKRVIQPALQKLQKLRVADFSGPYPADSFFTRASEFDAVIAQYHDQGLIPIKMQAFYEAINVTLGLPFLRTSVDHGTAFDLVGRQKASELSYLRALEYAYDFIQSEHSNSRSTRAQS